MKQSKASRPVGTDFSAPDGTAVRIGTATNRSTRIRRKRKLSPSAVMALGFLTIILIGSILLMFPISSRGRVWTPLIDTLFTSVSATCVTGLVVLDTGIHWSLFGQSVILCMIQLGGLGFMSFTMMLTGVFSRHVSPRVRSLAAQSFGMDTAGGIRQFVGRIFVGTAAIEGGGALLLMTRTIPLLGTGRGIFAGIFLSVSAFCNAGFDPLGGVTSPFSSLTDLETDPVLLLTLSAVIVLGAAGFLVWSDLWDRFRRKKRISMYSRFVLLLTAILLGGGTVLFAVFEWNNPATIGDLPVWQKLLHAFFQSVTPRTAGFDAIGQTELTECSKAVSMMLMFVGGASGSTAGGIKIGTFGVLMAAVFTTMRGDREVRVMRRRIDRNDIMRALAIMFSVLFAVMAYALIIASADGVALESALYECFSAFCTVGLSLSLTPTLHLLSKVLLITAMYTGRVGILTLSVLLMRKNSDRESVEYPTAKLLIG